MENNPKDISLQKGDLKLKFSAGGTIAALIRLAFDVGEGAPKASTLAEMAKAIGYKESKERQAYLLVANSLVEGFREQLHQRINQASIDEHNFWAYDARELRFDIFDALDDNDYFFNCDYINNPKAFPLLQDFKEHYQNWLRKSLSISDEQSQELAALFPRFFSGAFYSALMGGKYTELINWCKNPLLDEWHIEKKREFYQDKLLSHYHQQSLGQPNIALPDVYIEPSFRVFDQILPEALKKQNLYKDKEEHFIEIKYEGNIHDYLKKHFLRQKPLRTIGNKAIEQGRMLILLGQPGHGKSSFCYRSMYDLLSDPNFSGNVFFYRLQQAEELFINSPIEALDSVFQKEDSISFKDWIDNRYKQQNVLFLDGLDEMYMTLDLNESKVVRMIERLQLELNSRPNLYIVITSRFNYVESEKLYSGNNLLLALDYLTLKQQKQIVHHYQRLNGQCNLSEELLEKCSKDHNLEYIKHLIELPILLQMVLISGVDVEAKTSKATIYDQLFENVLNRKWDKDKRLKKYARDNNFKPIHLRRYMSLLAFKIYQYNKGYLNKKDVEGLEETKAFVDRCLKLESADGKASLKYLLKDVLTSFYLKETRKSTTAYRLDEDDSPYSIEFLHKSLYEYLACEYIWENVKKFFLKKDEDDENEYKRHKLDEVQRFLQNLFAIPGLSRELMEHLRDIIDHDAMHHDQLLEQMSLYLPELLQYGFIYDYRFERKVILTKYYAVEQQSINAFQGFWVILGQLHFHQTEIDDDWLTFKERHREMLSEEGIVKNFKKNTERIINGLDKSYYVEEHITAIEEALEADNELFYKWVLNKCATENKKFQYWTRRFFYWQKGRAKRARLNKVLKSEVSKINLARWLRLTGAKLNMSLNLSFTSLEGANLVGLIADEVMFNGVNLRNADLRNADLNNVYLNNADLSNANLRNADLSIVYLHNADLRYAHLNNVDLTEGDLSNADLCDANLSNANLTNANLSNANLSGVIFCNANLDNANLSNANLYEAILSNAGLCNIDLSNADLRNADLSNADLRNADLRNADLRNAILHEANIREADFRGANLFYVDLSNAILREADLSNANLQEANLSNANLQEADLCKTDISGADLSNAYLRNADLSNAILHEADLSNAILHEADLSNAILREADLSNAILYEANLCNTDLSGTDLSNAYLREADLSNANLSKVKVNHSNWIKNLMNLSVVGAYEIAQRYKISDQEELHIDRYGGKFKAYVLIPIEMRN